jgi:hypothetical protein
MPTDPKSFPEEYLYSLSRPSAPPPKKRRWWIALPIAALLLLLFLGALALSRRGGDPPLHTETHREETSVQSDTEAAEEAETVDKYGLYEGGEVIVGVSGYAPDFPEGDHGYEKQAVEYFYDRIGKIEKGRPIADDAAPATCQLGSAGVFTEKTLYYQQSYENGEASYRLYADETGLYTYLFTVDGRFEEYDMPADGVTPFEDDGLAVQAALDFLRSVGVEITNEYTCTVMAPSEPNFFDTDPKDGRASKVFVTRNIGGMIGEGYVVYCGMSIDAPEVIYSRVINEGMYEAFGYVTEEQVEHTRRRLYEAIGLLEQERCDSYEIKSGRKEKLILSGDHLYLRVWITPVGVDPLYYGDIGDGICEMRIDP